MSNYYLHRNVIKTALLCIFLFLLSINIAGAAYTGQMVIIYSGSANGILESCRCPGNPFGGLIKRASAIDSLKSIYPDALVLDTGDFLPPRRDELKSTYMLQALQKIGYDAIAPGDQDFLTGIKPFQEFDLPLISSSYIEKREDSLLFPPFSEFSSNGIDIVVVSLSDMSSFLFFPDSMMSEFTIDDPFKSWENFSENLRSRADIVVLLSHMGHDNDLKFAELGDAPDLIISGHSQVLLEEPVETGNSIIVSPGKNGEHLGLLIIKIKNGKIQGFENSLIPLDDRFDDAPDIEEIYFAYNEALREDLKRKAILAGREYIGTEVCVDCHQKQYEWWSSTSHAESYQTLIDAGKNKEPSCLDCHTTGYGFSGGFRDSMSTPKMANVGCEECHRIPKSTDFLQDIKHPVLPVIERWCTKCHIKPHIEKFDFESYRDMILHE